MYTFAESLAIAGFVLGLSTILFLGVALVVLVSAELRALAKVVQGLAARPQAGLGKELSAHTFVQAVGESDPEEI